MPLPMDIRASKLVIRWLKYLEKRHLITVLSNEDRGALERAIDSAMESYVPVWLTYFRGQDNKNRMQYQHAEDVVFGVVWGAVLATFLPTVMPKLLDGTLKKI
jgi:hypothetical protein